MVNVGDKVKVLKKEEYGSGSHVSVRLLAGAPGWVQSIDGERIVVHYDQFAGSGDYYLESELEIWGDMENLKAGDILVDKTNVDEDRYIVLGIYHDNDRDVDMVMLVDVYDNSGDRRAKTLDNVKELCFLKGEIPEEPEVKEVTLQEVADSMGIDVSTLRIKEQIMEYEDPEKVISIIKGEEDESED